jgi:hypothetical protein
MDNLVVNHALRDMIKYLTIKESEKDRVDVAKYFSGELFFGKATVDFYDKDNEEANFLVKYDDGDSEHMTEAELKEGINLYKVWLEGAKSAEI